jgi:hypothetical protein
MNQGMNEILKKIREAAEFTVAQMVDVDSSLAQTLENSPGSNLAINSSFLYRDKRSVKTVQSSRRVAVKVSKSGKKTRAETVSIFDGPPIKKHYRILSDEDAKELVPLEQAVSQEVASLGDLIFVLIGTIKGLRPSAEPVGGKIVSELRLTPSQGGEFEKIEEGVYSIKKIMPVEELLAKMDDDLSGQGGLPGSDREKIATAYDLLLDNATTDVVVPTGKKVSADGTILGQIAGSLRRQTEEYSAALKALDSSPKDEHALNEVLRIAYNFTTDVMPLVYLFMSICDLKPIIFWCTVDAQWSLSSAFTALPWAALGRKEKLEEYQQIVSQARNHAFHHVLPFDSTVEIDVSDLEVRAEKIRLFTPYGGKHEKGVRLKDHALADLFDEFSRAKWRPVSNVFWKANLKVMKAASDLAKAILDTLILLHHAKAAFQ